MYWIWTHKGRLVNLALATDVLVQSHESKDGVREVKAYFVSGGETSDASVLFQGTPEGCDEYLCRLRNKLSAVAI